MIRLLVIADSHGDEKVMRNILSNEQYDYSIHCGDFCIQESKIKALFDYYVGGNNDWDVEKKVEFFNIEGFNFLLKHGDDLSIFWENNPGPILDQMKKENIDVLLLGHTHRPFIEEKESHWIFNPGSIVQPRSSVASYGIIEIAKGNLNLFIKKVDEL